MTVVLDGHDVLFDDEDLMKLFNYKWRIYKRGNTHYADTGSNFVHGRRVNGMQHIVMGYRPGFHLDHINGNGLDNRKCNLRFGTPSENQYNQGPREGRRFKGVYRHGNRWRAFLQKNKKPIHLGYFDTQEEAAVAYNKGALKHHGEFAKLNEVTLAL